MNPPTLSPQNITAPPVSTTGLNTLPTMSTMQTPNMSNISAGQNALSQLQSTPTSTPTTPAPSGPTGILGDISRLAPTIGAVALPTIADFLTGGLALPADMGLAGLGGGLGKAVENASQGKNPLSVSDLLAAGEGAAGQGIGQGIVGPALSKLGGGLASAGAKATADAGAAADQAATEAGAKATQANFPVDKGSQIANNLQDNQDLVKDWGYDPTSPQHMQTASDGGVFVNDIDKEALAQGSPIPTNSVVTAHDVVTASPEEQQAMLKAGIISDNGPGATLPKTITPQQASDYASSLSGAQRQARILMENASEKTPGEYDSLKQNYERVTGLYNKAKDAAGTDEVNAAVAARTISPAEKTLLVKQFGQKEADYIEEGVNNAKTHSDLVAVKRPFAEMNDVSRSAIRNQQASATPLGVKRATQGGISQIGGSPITRAAEIGGGVYEASKKNDKLAIPLMALGMLSGNGGAMSGIGGALSKIGGGEIPGAVGAGIGTSPNTVPQGGTMSPTSTDMNANLGNSALAKALSDALAGAQYPLMPGGSQDISSLPALIQAASQAETAQQSAQNMAQMAQTAGVGQGPIMGLLSRLGQTLTGGPASFINPALSTQENSAAKALAAAGVNPGTMPTVTQSQSTATQSMAGIQRLMQALGGGQVAPSPTGGLPLPAQ